MFTVEVLVSVYSAMVTALPHLVTEHHWPGHETLVVGKQQGEGGSLRGPGQPSAFGVGEPACQGQPHAHPEEFRRADRNGRSLIGDVDDHGIGIGIGSGPDVDVAPSMPGGIVQERVEDLGGGGFRRTGGTDAGGHADLQWPSCRGERCGPPLSGAG